MTSITLSPHAQLEELQKRAKRILQKKRVPDLKVFVNDETYQLKNDIELYQIELLLQNKDLCKALLKAKEMQTKYICLYDSIPICYFNISMQGNILDVNDAGEELFGIKKEDLINKNIIRYIKPDLQHNFIKFLKDMTYNSDSLQYETKFLRKHGPSFYAQVDCKVITNQTNNSTQLLMSIIDITERKKREQQSEHGIPAADRNLSMEKLTSVIAHELNHPIATITNFLNGSISRLESGKYQPREIINALKKAADQSQRITEIIHRMKNFTFKGNLECESVHLGSLIEEVINLIKYELGDSKINIIYKPQKKPIHVWVDRIHMQQVILNIARNAIEAIQDAHIDEPRLVIEENLVNPNTVEISISDNGPGIDEKHRGKLFQANYTTKSYGIGIGLFVCRAIVEAHDGEIYSDPDVFNGACFKITLRTAHKEIC